MATIESIRAHQQKFLEQVKARKDPLSYKIEGLEIVVNPGVFPPATDTRLLAANIQVSPGQRTLDLTSGSGTFSIIAGLQGATGIAVDINAAAVINSAENFQRHGVAMQALQSDLFEKVPDEKFDQIFANGPFFDGDISDPLDYACYGARKFIDDLLSGTPSRLKPEGKLLIVLSAWSDLEHFKEAAKRNGLETQLTATRMSTDNEREYQLYELSLPR